MNRRAKEKNETQEKEVMHRTIIYHLLTDAQPIPWQQSAALSQLSPVYIVNMAVYGMKYLFGYFRSAILAISPPGFLCTSSLAEHGKLKGP